MVISYYQRTIGYLRLIILNFVVEKKRPEPLQIFIKSQDLISLGTLSLYIVTDYLRGMKTVVRFKRQHDRKKLI